MSDGRKLLSVKRDGIEYHFVFLDNGDTLRLKSKDRPLPGLPSVLDELSSFAIEAVAFIDKKYHEKTKITGVSLDWKGDDERRNAVVHMVVDNGSQGLSEISSPKKLACNEKKEAKKPRWDVEFVKLIDQLQKHAFIFIDGDRSQQTMPIIDTKSKKKGKANDDQPSFDEIKAGKA